MGTFHSVCAKILRAESGSIGYPRDFTIYDTTDSKAVLRQIVKDLGEDEKIYKPGDLLGKISEAKNLMIDAVEYGKSSAYGERDRRQRHYRMAEVYREYERRLRLSSAMDFDDLLLNVNRLFASDERVRKKYQEGWQYILVDEYQDTNFSQYLIVRTLAERHRHICVVGDDAQSIYAFRGADIRNILMFQKDYPGSPVFKLERNYRSTQHITNAANSLIHHNRQQIRKDVYSENAVGEPLHVRSYGSDREEAKAIVERLESRRAGYRWSEMAVLYRTNAQSRVIEDELRARSIPYSIYGGLSFYQRKEVKDALALFRIAVNPRDNEALTRVVSVSKGIGETTLRHIRDAANGRGVCYFEVCRSAADCGLPCSAATLKRISALAEQISQYGQMAETLDAYTFATEVMSRSGLMASAALDTSPEGLDRLENLKELQAAVHEFVEINSVDDSLVRIHDFLSEVALLTDQDTNQKGGERVSLMTIHAAKGLEFSVVCIAGLEENLFPSPYVQTESELEEERRLLYVAITRAKEVCYLTCARTRFKNGQFSFQSPSRFLREIDGAFVERGEESTSQRVNESTSWDGRASLSSLSSRAREARQTEEIPGSPKRNSGAYAEGERVVHSVFGPGTVLACYEENGNEKADVRFDRSGKKTLLLKFAKLERI